MEAGERKSRKKKGPFKCEIQYCSAVYTRSNDLKRHLQSHRDERNFVCTHPDCGKAFVRKSTLTEHLARHTSPKKERKKKVLQVPRYKCKICPKMFNRFHDFQRHERKHNGEKPFACYFPNCNKTFKRAYNAKVHMQSQHGGVKKFECHDCDEKYAKKCTLVKHIVNKHLNDKQQPPGVANTIDNKLI